MTLKNFRTAILFSACCLCTCSMSLNAQEIDIDLSLAGTGDNLNVGAIDGNRELFTATVNPDDPETTLNVLNTVVTVDVAEDPGDLTFSITEATATTGIDGFGGDNRASLNITGLGIAIAGPTLRLFPGTSANVADSSIRSSNFRLDSVTEEFLTIAFNQDVVISAIGVTNLTDGETFQFGTESFTNADTGFVLGGLSGNVDLFTFDTPLEIAANEGIFVGNTVVDRVLLDGASGGPTPGVGFERIILEVVGGSTPPVPEPSSLALLGLGGLLIAGRRRRG